MYLTNFQSFVFGAFLIFILCFAACEKGITGSPVVAPGEKVELKQSEKAWFGTDTENGLKFLVEQINDSRCPKQATCIWAGEAVVKVNITDPQKNFASFTLYIGARTHFQPDTLDFNLDKKTYRVILFGVSPYPMLNGSQDGSKAELTLLQK